MACLFQPGDGLGGYRIARLLGAGGFAEVYEAIDRAGVRRALKVLSAEASRGPKMRAGLAREASALARIEHINVVRFYEAGIEEDHVYLVLEMVEGVTLADEIADPTSLAPLEDVVRWMHQAAEGVAEAHREGVIHRDLKPANILVTRSDVVKVIDFGIAQLRTWSSGPHQDSLLGTALYMAPEQLHAQPSDARADVYSMGVILYEALAGAHPLGLNGAAPTVFQVFQQHLIGEPRSLRELAPEVPPELAELVHQALAKDPARRTPTMRALADGLHASLDEMRRARRAAVRRIAAIGYDVEATGPLSSPDPSSSRPPAPRSDRPTTSSYPEFASIRPDATSSPAFDLPRPSEPVDDGATAPDPRPTLRAPAEAFNDGDASGPKPRAPAEPSHDGAASVDEHQRSALPPPPPREGTPRPPPPASVPPLPASLAGSDEGDPGLAGGVQPSRPSVPRGSSAVPVTLAEIHGPAARPAGAGGPRVSRIWATPARRRAIPALAALLLVLTATALWWARAHPPASGRGALVAPLRAKAGVALEPGSSTAYPTDTTAPAHVDAPSSIEREVRKAAEGALLGGSSCSSGSMGTARGR